MTKPTGTITVTKRHDYRGGIEGYDYRYEGGDIIEISESFIVHNLPPGISIYKLPLNPGDRFEIGPFRFRILRRRIYCFNKVWAIRERGLVTDICYLRHRFGRLADIAYRRLVLTLTVWRLAEYQEGRIPSWEDVYALRKLRRK